MYICASLCSCIVYMAHSCGAISSPRQRVAQFAGCDYICVCNLRKVHVLSIVTTYSLIRFIVEAFLYICIHQTFSLFIGRHACNESLIKHSYENVPYYREIMQKRKLTPADIKSVSDLMKLPILTKKKIRENFNEQ